MTGEEMERAVEFLLDHHAKFSADIDALKEAQLQTTRDMAQTTRDIKALTETVARSEAQAEATREEMREAISNLILANEITRDLAEKVARLEVQTSQRVTGLDGRVTDLESKLP